MHLNLDTLKDEILGYLQAQGFVVFHGLARLQEGNPAVHWDTRNYPDYRMFLDAAREAGARLIVFGARSFSSDMVEEALARLEDCDLARDERRALERRLRELRGYEGFTCALELSFDQQGRCYLFSLEADWYAEYLDLLDEIEAALPEEEEDEDSMGGYFSRN